MTYLTFAARWERRRFKKLFAYLSSLGDTDEEVKARLRGDLLSINAKHGVLFGNEYFDFLLRLTHHGFSVWWDKWHKRYFDQLSPVAFKSAMDNLEGACFNFALRWFYDMARAMPWLRWMDD